jgi:hypothetical protein
VVTEIGIFTQPLPERFLRLEGINTAQGNAKVLVELYRVAFDPLKEISFISTSTTSSNWKARCWPIPPSPSTRCSASSAASCRSPDGNGVCVSSSGRRVCRLAAAAPVSIEIARRDAGSHPTARRRVARLRAGDPSRSPSN